MDLAEVVEVQDEAENLQKRLQLKHLLLLLRQQLLGALRLVDLVLVLAHSLLELGQVHL